VKIPISSILPWLIPPLFILLSAALTIPWTFWVIYEAYNRDVLENARMLAKRVEIRILSSPEARTSPKQASDALNAELASDDTVQLAIFFDLTNPGVVRTGSMWRTGHEPPPWTLTRFNAVVDQLKAFGIVRNQDANTYYITVAWKGPERILGFTYLELSRAALAGEFKEKEGPLIKRVVALTAAAMLLFSGLATTAFWTWMRAARARQRAELQQQGIMAERGLTAAVLAHEIRNPLAALRFQLHTLRNNTADPARITGTADMIDGELLRIGQLVSDYLEHEKARSMRVQNVDLADAAHKLRGLLDPMTRHGDTHVEVAAPPEPVIVTCDPHALRQILMNLAINAQQAIKLRPGPGRIVLRIGQAEGFGAIDVSDNGPGIPPEIRDRLFKPFQTTKQEGHGIGLALVKRFVDNFGGSVTVDSEPGKGTVFHLRLPLAEVSG